MLPDDPPGSHREWSAPTTAAPRVHRDRPQVPHPAGMSVLHRLGSQAPLPEPGHPAWHHPGRPCTDAAAAARLLAREEGHAAPAKLPDPAPERPALRPSTPRPPSAESRCAPPKRQKPGMAGLLKQAPRRTGAQQTRWISAWRTGSRDGPCADRPSYARLRGRHGS
ncbi:hypothetical protein FHT15_002280 [Xanthomonas campestris]